MTISFTFLIPPHKGEYCFTQNSNACPSHTISKTSLASLVFKSDRHVCSQIPDSFIPLYSENYAHDVSSTLFVEQLFKITTDKAVRLLTFCEN